MMICITVFLEKLFEQQVRSEDFTFTLAIVTAAAAVRFICTTLASRMSYLSSKSVKRTLLMGFGFFMMIRKSLYLPCAILGAVWLLHILYFGIVVKTRKTEDDKSEEVYYTVEN